MHICFRETPLMIATVKSIFIDPSVVRQVNATLIVLILKVGYPLTIRDFRPISPSNIIYKGVTTLSPRYRFLLDHWSRPKLVHYPFRIGIDLILEHEVLR